MCFVGESWLFCIEVDFLHIQHNKHGIYLMVCDLAKKDLRCKDKRLDFSGDYNACLPLTRENRGHKLFGGYLCLFYCVL